MENNYRPTRLDHFPNTKSLVQWLIDRRLPVSQDHGDNITTMLRATGGGR